MGAFYRSFSIPGDIHEVVDQTIKKWLSRKGFEETDKPGVFDRCGEGERAYFLCWNEHWTIVLYSHFEEDERLLFELNNNKDPILHLWVHDSDLWGYELHLNHRPLTAFNSNPEYFGSQDQPEAPNDIGLLIEKCSIQGVGVSEIKNLQKKRGVFKERICEEFAMAIGAGPAASQYDYASEERLSSSDFSVVHRHFRKRGFDPVGDFSLHATHAKTPPTEGPSTSLMPTLPVGYKILIEVMKVVAIPLGWLARMVIAIRMKMKPGGFPGIVDATSNIKREHAFEEGWLVNQRRRCRLQLLEGTVPCEGPGILPFSIGGNEVFSTVIPAKSALELLAGAFQQIEEDSDFWVGSLPAKFVCTELATQPERFLYMFYIQAPFAVYFFRLSAEAALSSTDLDTYRRTIESFEILSE
jgi:hypothetical protein